jgi:hypothetical protein
VAVAYNINLYYVLQRHEERVIIISSKDSDNTFSDAENALQQIASLILKVMCFVVTQLE